MAEFLQSAAARASGLVIEGEAGIGKTTLWLAAVAQARERGFAVVSARVGQAESVLAYAAVADLLGNVDPALFAELPDVQRVAVDRVLLRSSSEGPSDRSPCGRGGPGVIDRTARGAHSRVDRDRRRAVARPVQPGRHRVRGPAARWPRRHAGHRAVRCRQWDLGHVAASRQAGWHRANSVGALESRRTSRADLGATRPNIRASDDGADRRDLRRKPVLRARTGARDHMGSARAQPSLPATLAELMRMRIGSLERQAGDVLLVAAAIASPTVEVLAQVVDTTSSAAVELLEEAKARASSRLTATRCGSPIRCWRTASTPTPVRPSAGPRTGAWPNPWSCPSSRPGTWLWRRRARTPKRSKRSTLPPTPRALAVPPPRRPNWSNWPSGSAGTRRRAESARPSTISRPATPTGPAHCWSRPSIELQPGLLRGIALNLMAGNPHVRRHFRRSGRAPRARTRRRRAQPRPSGPNPDVVGVRPGNGRPVRRIVTQCPPSRDTRRGDRLSAADQSGTRDVGQHDVPVRPRGRRGSLRARWSWRIPTSTCQFRSAPAPSTP